MSDSPQLHQVSQQHSTRCFSSLSPSQRMQGGEEEMQLEGVGSFLQATSSWLQVEVQVPPWSRELGWVGWDPLFIPPGLSE